MEHTEKGRTYTELLLSVFRLNGVLLAEGDRLGADLGLTSARWQVMGAIDEMPRTVPQIAREMGLTRQGVQRTVNVLVAEGMVELDDNPDHKRAKLVRLSDEGRRRLDQLSARQVEWANAIAAQLSLADLKTTARTLGTLRETLESP